MLNLNAVSVSYGATQVVQEVSLALETGEIGCLLGPSGCGKTTLLRAISGFEPITSGNIGLNGSIVSEPNRMTAVQERHLGLVFQDFALFPHLTVEGNIGFGLQHLSQGERKRRVAEVLTLVGLEDYAATYPHALSGGQQQRVALARALAPEPQLLLLDEPFSSLDTQLRLQLAADIREILKRTNTTALLVTHDQDEAFAFADVIGVMGQGKLHQWDNAYAIYHRPITAHVADFIGESIWLDAQYENATLISPLGQFPLPAIEADPHQAYKMLVRPDDVIHDDESPYFATITAKHFRGANTLFELDYLVEDGAAPISLLCLAPSHHDHSVGDKFGIRLDIQDTIAFANE